MTINRKTVDVMTAVAAVLTVIAALPYEVELMETFPPSWKPWVASIGVLATGGLRILKIFLPAKLPDSSP